MTELIRPAQEADWDAIVALESLVWRESGLSDGAAALRRYAEAGLCLVLELDGRIVAYVIGFPYPAFQYPLPTSQVDVLLAGSDNFHGHDVVVAEEFRGQQLATRLLDRLDAIVRQRGYRRMSGISVAGTAEFWAARGHRPYPSVLVEGYGEGAVYVSKTVDD